MTIQPIVEGHGDVAAVPVLLRRLVQEAQAWGIEIGRPIRRPRNQLVRQADVERAVKVALKQPGCGAVFSETREGVWFAGTFDGKEHP